MGRMASARARSLLSASLRLRLGRNVGFAVFFSHEDIALDNRHFGLSLDKLDDVR